MSTLLEAVVEQLVVVELKFVGPYLGIWVYEPLKAYAARVVLLLAVVVAEIDGRTSGQQGMRAGRSAMKCKPGDPGGGRRNRYKALKREATAAAD